MAHTPITAGVTAAAQALVDAEAYIALDQAPAHFPGKRVHRATVWRWHLTGLHRHGQIIRLRTVTVGCRRYTTQRWIDEFVARCNGEPAPTASPSQRQRRAAAAMTTLAGMGVGTSCTAERS